MAIAVVTVRRPRLGPALRRAPMPLGGLAISFLCHGLLFAAILITGYVWRATQPKAYVVNLVPAVPAIGSPSSRPAPTPAPALPDREPARSTERTPSKPSDLPDRTPAPRESAALPDRSLPTRAPSLPRPGEKELPRVASTTPPLPSPSAATTRPTPPAPPSPRGLPTGSAQGAGTLSLNAGDFPFAWYLQAIHRKISEKWDAQARDGNQPQVVFDISRDGKVTWLAIEKTSGNPLYDQAALRAITEATPFPELPKEFTSSFLRVHLGFTYSGTRG